MKNATEFFHFSLFVTEILIAKLVIPIGILTKEAKAEMETHPVIAEPKIRKCSI